MKQRVVRVYGWLYLMVAVLFFVGCPTDSDDDGDAATPIISDSSQLKDATYEMDAEDVTPLSVVATITDGGVLTYQWYVSTGEEVPGTPLPSQAPHTSYIPSTDTIGIRWYYVEVTNTNTKVTGKQTVTTVGKKVQIEITSKEEAVFGETGASVYDLDGEPFTGNYTVNVRFLNADGKKRDVKVGTIEDGKLTFAIFQSLLPNEDELVPYPAMSGITMTPSDLKVAHWEFCLTGTDAAAATLGLEYRKADQSIMGSYGRSCQYFSSDATITGSVSDGDEGMTFTMSLQIDVKQGWNRTYEVLKMSEEGIESSMTTSPDGIPSDCQWSFRNLSEDFRDTETPSYVKEGEIIFQVDSSNGPRFFSLSTGEWVDASEAASKNWDLAFQRMRKIYTNSGTSAQEFLSNGNGGVWYTDKTDFDAVTSKDDAVTNLDSILSPYVTDQTRYTGTSKGYLARINLMTYMGYLNEATASGTTEEDFLMYASGAGASYLPTAFYDIAQKETGQVYIIRHADGKTYSKIQVYDFEFISSSVAPSGLGTDSYKVRYAVFK